MKLCVNLKSAIHKCSAVDTKVIMGEPSAVLSLASVGCMGCLVAIFNPFESGMLE